MNSPLPKLLAKFAMSASSSTASKPVLVQSKSLVKSEIHVLDPNCVQ